MGKVIVEYWDGNNGPFQVTVEEEAAEQYAANVGGEVIGEANAPNPEPVAEPEATEFAGGYPPAPGAHSA